MSKRSIIILVNELLRGGAQRIVADIAKGLDARQFHITVVTLKSPSMFGNADTLENEVRASGVQLISMEGGKRVSWREFRRLVRFLRSERPDVVHTFLPYAGIIGRVAARIARVPHIVSTQCNTRVAYSALGFWADKVTLMLADAWVAASTGIELAYAPSAERFSRASWQSGRRHFTVTTGVDLPVFDKRVSAADKASIRREIGVPIEAPLIFSVSRLVPWKGVGDIVAAMQYLPDMHCAIVGWGAMEARLKEEAEKNGTIVRMHFLGARNDIPELLAAADVYVQAHKRSKDGNIWMGPNTSQMEACAARVPSISTRVPLIEELIEDDVTGMLAIPNDPVDIAKVISRICADKDKARRLAEAARRRVEECFSTASMVRSYKELYLLLSGTPSV